MYLYLGYLLIQCYPSLDKLLQSNLSVSITIFSVIVVFLWSLIPLPGYYLARLFKAPCQLSNVSLLLIGISIGLIEDSLFYVELLTKEQSALGLVIVCLLFFIVGMIAPNKANTSNSVAT